MKFGLFTSAQANSGELGPETGQGFRDYLDFNVAAERLGFVSSFLVDRADGESFATWVARADEELLRGEKVLVAPGLEAAS